METKPLFMPSNHVMWQPYSKNMQNSENFEYNDIRLCCFVYIGQYEIYLNEIR